LIDTHCHLLPGLDDGPKNKREALDLARSLVAQGVTGVLCTPHYSRLFHTSHTEASGRFAELTIGLLSSGLPLEVSLAAEVDPAHSVSAPLEELARRAIAGRFLLVEVLPDSPPSFFAAVYERIQAASLVPIFGHPERSRAVQRHPDVLDPLRRDGALVQVVAPSLLGRWGEEVAAAAWRLVDTGRADLLASDAHGPRRRRAHLLEAYELVEERLGSAVGTELTETKPRLVLAGVQPESP
jgi:protein-tyrosine phosphatase